jgi:hypothetical protein
MYLILPTALGPGVYSASNRNEYQKHKIIMFLGSKVWQVHRANYLTAICELTVWTMWDPYNPSRSPRSVIGMALLFEL